MNSSKFTPGPWVYAKDDQSQRPCVTTVALCCDYVIGLPSSIPGGNYRDGDPSGDPEADARLIAAAPDLLKAAADVVSHMEGRQPVRGWLRDNDKSRDALSRLLAAIQAATGEQA